MKPRLLIVALVISLLAAVPVAATLKQKSGLLEIERSEKQQLELRFETQAEKLEREQAEREQQEQQNQKLKEQNEQLKKDLQAKRERQEQARLAAQQEQEQQQVVEQKPAASASYAVGCDNYRNLVAQYDWDTNTMLRIMKAESGCNPTNHNHADNHRSCLGSYGLMQIGCVHGYSVAHLENPANNVAAAYKIYKSQGYTAWTTY